MTLLRVPGRDPSIHITAAAEDRGDLIITILDDRTWSIFEPSPCAFESLGTIVERDGIYFVSHDDASGSYCFSEFGHAVTYFMEYSFALTIGQAR